MQKQDQRRDASHKRKQDHAQAEAQEKQQEKRQDRRQLPPDRARQQKKYHADDARSQARRKADFERRLRAAGIDRNAKDENIDAFRYRLARTIYLHLNDWEGCPLRLCQRMRGCMAPQSTCANNAGDPPTTEQEWDESRIEWRLALNDMIERAGGPDAFEAAADASIHDET